MRVICCYTSEIHPKALGALARYAPEAEIVETKGLFGYNDAIASRWDGSSDLVVVEGDKEITAEVLPSFARCDHPWCVYSYGVYPEPYRREIDFGLGCAKFSAEVQQIVKPSEFLTRDPECLPYPCPDCGGEGCWRYLDSRIMFAMLFRGIESHVHGQVEHHHDYPADWAEQRDLKEQSWLTKLLSQR